MNNAIKKVSLSCYMWSIGVLVDLNKITGLNSALNNKMINNTRGVHYNIIRIVLINK